MDGSYPRTTTLFLQLFDGRYPWQSHEERIRAEASSDPAEHNALEEVNQLTQAAWDWMERHAPVPWTLGDAAKELSDHLAARFPWCVGVVLARLLNWAQWISWHEGLAEVVARQPDDP